jgi:DNA-binding response OmpR family regulator
MSRSLLAVVIEPSDALAQTVAEVLRQHGFETLTASTHAGGARQVEKIPRVDFLAAAVPAPGEDRVGAYLEAARTKNSAMGVLVMLSDPNESFDDAPRDAVRIIKPFSREELRAAIDRAMQPSHNA